MPDLPPEGWYPDPESAEQVRYWDGAAWTDQRAPRHAARPAPSAPKGRKAKPAPPAKPDKAAVRAARAAELAEAARLADAEYEAALDSEFEAAARAASEKSVVSEEYALQRALQLARKTRGKSGVRDVEARIQRGRADGSLLPAFSLIGIVKPEGFLSYLARSQEMLSHRGGKPIYIYSDRVLHGSMVWPFDASVQAQFFLDGQKQVTTRASLSSALLLSPLPGSAIIPALARPKKETHDKRIAEFHLAGDGWSTHVRTHPDQSAEMRSLAEQVNRHADRLAGLDPALADAPVTPASATPATGPPIGEEGAPADLIEQFERIAALAERGAITADEATALKSRLLGG